MTIEKPQENIDTRQAIKETMIDQKIGVIDLVERTGLDTPQITGYLFGSEELKEKDLEKIKKVLEF